MLTRLLIALALPGMALANPCGSLATSTGGPWDYRVERGHNRFVVERRHFTPKVEALLAGETTSKANIGGDIAYTLRAFPNHHRALMAMTRLVKDRGLDPPPAVEHPLDCWYERALRFRPDDTVVRMLFARYLNDSKRRPDALRQLWEARQLAGDNPFTHYNLGLLYLELGEPAEALVQAHRASALGLERSELRDKLKAGGHWKEAEELAAAAAAASAASAAAAASAASAAAAASAASSAPASAP